MSRKAFFSLLLLLVVLFSSFSAFRGELSAEYSYHLPQNSHIADIRFDALWGNTDSISYGIITSLGYGIEHFTRFGSNALIAGPEISLGPEIRISINERLATHASVQLYAAYPLYPTVLRAKAAADVCFLFSERMFAGLGAGVLYPDWCASFSLTCGVKL